MKIRDEIFNHLTIHFPKELVEKLIDNYLGIESNYFLKKYREASQYGGRFSEITIRIIQYVTQSGSFTPLGTKLSNIHDLIINFGNLPRNDFVETIRINIPRALDVLYGIRNKRDVGHVGGDLNANFADASLSLYLSSWILIELLRSYYTGDIDQAQKMVNKLVSRKFSIVQDFNGFQKILTPDLSLPKKALVLIFQNEEGVSFKEITEWLGTGTDIPYLRKVLGNLENKKAYIHFDKNKQKYLITNVGICFLENNIKMSFE